MSETKGIPMGQQAQPSQPNGNGETSAPKPGPFDVVAPAPGMVETRN
jgi:hypothetical protein